MLKILYLAPYFWPEQIGSAPYCTELAEWLREQGFEIDVVAFRPHYPTAGQFEPWLNGARDDENYHGMVIKRVPTVGRGSGGFKDRIKNDLRYLALIVRRTLLRKIRKPDVVVAYVPTVLTLYGAVIVRVFTGARIVAVVHDVESGLAASLGMMKNRHLLGFMRKAERFGFNSADHAVVLTDEMKNELREIGCRTPITTLPIWASPFSKSVISKDQTPILMYSGNFGKKQNLDQLLPLISRLSKERSPIQVVMRGDGSEKARIKAKLEAEGVSNTQFLPLVETEHLAASLQAANIHVVPQALNVANFAVPSKIFSIMAAGRPFVSIAEKGSPVDRLARMSGAGICLQAGDHEGFYRAITNLSLDFDLQIKMGDSGRRFVSEFMNKQNIMRSYREIIVNTAAGKNA